MKQNRRRVPRVLAVSIVSLIAGILPAAATPLIWDSDFTFANGVSDGSGTWDTTNPQWNNGVDDAVWNNLTNDVAVFGDGLTGGFTPATVTVGAPITAGGITFRTSSIVSGYT